MTDDASSPTRPRAQAKPRPRWSLLVAVAVGVLVLDQLTKRWAVDTLGSGRVIELVGSLQLQLHYNTGAAFSLSEGNGPIISLLAVIVVGVLVFSGRQATRPLAAIALGMVLGGAFGNLSDRAFRDGDGFLGGGVVDFIDLQWWPVFNVADSGVVCGALLLVATSWREDQPSDDDPDAGRDDAGTEPDPPAGTTAAGGVADRTDGSDSTHGGGEIGTAGPSGGLGTSGSAATVEGAAGAARLGPAGDGETGGSRPASSSRSGTVTDQGAPPSPSGL